MTEKSREIEDIQEVEDMKETEEEQEMHEVQDITEVEEVQESQEEQDILEAEEAQDVLDEQDDESQMPDEEQPDVDFVSRASSPRFEGETPSTHSTPTMESVVEAVLFASYESLTDARLASIVETSAKQVRQHIKNLNDKYQANNNAFRIEQIAGGYQMLTLSPYNHWLKKLLRARSDNKLSPAAMETLAIIAYKQPVMRADIEAIRGVAVGEVIRSLSYKGFVKIVGRAEVLGRPMLYGTTKKFLEVFGLNTLKDLPKAQELKEPSS
jgi:segregation and condensation protein B